MKTITLIRHAHAEAGINKIDLHRQLSARGKEEAKRQSEKMTLPDDAVLFISPSERTLETASYWLKKQPNLRQKIVSDLYNADLETLLNCIEEHADENHLVVIAHNPGISELYQYLTGLWTAFEPCTVALLQRETDTELIVKGKATILAYKTPGNNE
jgi:phosphohistidine phosphatase